MKAQLTLAPDPDDDPQAENASQRIEHVVVSVDSEMAKRWLAQNRRNRPPSMIVVNRYVSDMAHGRWQFAGDPIRFDTMGNLLDGQHRLMALSRVPGLTLQFLVVRGLHHEAQTVMDQGSKRTPGQQLALSGVKNYNAVAAAARICLAWEGGLLFRDAKQRTSITSARIEEFVHRNLDVVAKFNAIYQDVLKNDARPAVAGAAAMRFLMVDDAATAEFFHLLATGAGREGHPIVALDQRLRNMRRNRQVLPERDVLAYFILAWNAWRDGKPLSRMQGPRGGAWTSDNFPVPH